MEDYSLLAADSQLHPRSIKWRHRRKPYIAIVAIDFGTTFSGFAFSFKAKMGEPGIHMNKVWGSELGYQTLKTPTSILLTPDQKFDKFGYEAAEKYSSLEEADGHKFLYFERFKMLLHSNENLTRKTRIKAKNGDDMMALDIFAKSLSYLKDKALNIISDNTSFDYTIEEIQWVITVPAIWKPSAKQFMREAAHKAGLTSPNREDQIIIALEPEAAALYCRQLQMKEFVGEKGPASVKDTYVRRDTKYLVADIGGGTLDVTVHQIIEDDKVREIYRATGGSFGGTKVDDQFVKLLEEIFGTKFIKQFSKQHPSDWLDMMNDFEVRKRSERVTEGTTRIRLPTNFKNFFRHFQKGLKDENEAIERIYKPEEVKIYRDFFCIDSAVMKKLFNPAISDIIKHIKELLQKSQLAEVKLIFLVGGFAESPFLQRRILEALGTSYKILIPVNARTAVLRGAVMFGNNPTIVEERCLTQTYGTDAYRDFDWINDPRSKLVMVEERAKCRDHFSVLARKDEVVKIGKSKNMSSFQPLYSEQTAISFEFYTTEGEAKYVTDQGVKKLPGRALVVKSPDTKKGKDRFIELNLFFGGTEIKATAVDVETSKSETAYIDFLSEPC